MKIELDGLQESMLNALLGLAVVILSAMGAILSAIATQLWLQLLR